MSRLPFEHVREIESIVDHKLNQHSLTDTLTKYIEHVQFSNMIQSKVNNIIPKAGKEWVQNHLRIEVESIANNYMRNNFQTFFRKEVSDNKEVTGFISSHLKDVEKQIDDVTNKTVSNILKTNTKYNPIFKEHLEILAEQNKAALKQQSNKIANSIAEIDGAVEHNKRLTSQVDSLETKCNILGVIVVASLVAVGYLSATSDRNSESKK